MSKIFDSVIYVVLTPDGIPIKAYTSEKSAKEHLVKEMLDRGERFGVELVNLDVDLDFIKRAEVFIEYTKE